MPPAVPRTASGAAARSLTSREFLRHYEKLLRPALDVWAAELLTRWKGLDTTPSAGPGDLESASSCLNKGSFVVASAGQLDRALRMCAHQLAWVARLHRSGAEDGVLAHAVQPWINMGRLYALRGERKRAERHFGLAEQYARGESATLGPCPLPAEAWAPIVDAVPEMPRILWNTYALEKTKAALWNAAGPAPEAEGDTLPRIARLRRTVPPDCRSFLTEGEIIALLQQGDAEQALARLSGADPHSPYDESAFALHATTALLHLGRTSEARHRATGLLAFLTATDPRPRSKDAPTLLRQLHHLGLLLEALDAPRHALAAHLRGLDICTTQDDQPLRLAFLTTALRLAPHHPTAPTWTDERHTLHTTSLYTTVRRGPLTKTPGGTVFDDLAEAARTAAGGGAG
jgi:tetratricopeptide (TPR) repeat protein